MAVTHRLKDSLLGAAGLARSTGRLLRRTATPAARQAVTLLRSRLATESPAAAPPPRPSEPEPAPAPASATPATPATPASTPGAAKKRTPAKPPSPADVAPRVHPHPPEQQSGADHPRPEKKPAAKRSKPSAPGAKLPPRKPGSTGD